MKNQNHTPPPNHGTGGALPDLIGSSGRNQSRPDDTDAEDDHDRPRSISELSLEDGGDIDYHRSMPATPTKLTEL